MLKKSKCKRKNQKKQKNLIFLFQIEIRRVGKKFAFSVLGRGHAEFFPEDPVHIDSGSKTGSCGDLLAAEEGEGEKPCDLFQTFFHYIIYDRLIQMFPEKSVQVAGGNGDGIGDLFPAESAFIKMALYIVETFGKHMGQFLFLLLFAHMFQ